MRVFAYCAASFEEATRKAAGVQPLTCPPVSAGSFDPAWLEGDRKGRPYDLLYFDLHGTPGSVSWRGDDRIEALTALQISRARLGEPVVFATNCFLADERSPMMEALLDAGARLVIAGDGENWGPRGRSLYGAPLLGMWLRRWMQVRVSPLRALALAKRSVRLRGVAVEDTLAFRAYYREG
jgi:hypothetical protein